jgi:hypothetical protein
MHYIRMINMFSSEQLLQLFKQSPEASTCLMPPASEKGIHKLLSGQGFQDIMVQLAVNEMRASASKSAGAVALVHNATCQSAYRKL